jgi:RNA polymerase sigma-70 factor (ECF subfamily)
VARLPASRWLAVHLRRMAAPLDKSRPHLRLASAGGEPAARYPEPSLDDAQLLDALRRSDAKSAAALHDRARPLVMSTLGRLLGHSDRDRDDLCQLALMEFITTIDRFRGDCSLDGWISMITARVVYKHLRRRTTERQIFGGPVLEDAVSRHSPARDTIVRDLIERVREHLDELEPNKAWTFLLHDVCGYDLREIADITGASVAAAQTRLTRGRRELHERIAADPELCDRVERTEGDLP